VYGNCQRLFRLRACPRLSPELLGEGALRSARGARLGSDRWIGRDDTAAGRTDRLGIARSTGAAGR
jgi:hypothetical protein